MITEEIEKLIILQKIDEEIFEKEGEINSFPEKEKRFNREIEDIEKKIKEAKDDLKKIQLDRKEKELEIRSYEEEKNNLDKKLGTVKTNKEYEALLIEIANIKKKISDIEEEVLILMEKEEEIIKKEKILEEELKKIKEHIFKKIEEEKKKIENLKKELEIKKKEREELVKEIDFKAYNLYEKIRKNKKDNIAIVKIENGICSGCFMSLPTYIVERVKKKKEIVQCENCSRILY
ncbi:MAG: C4-type zinc ribbon domain-containing protein [Candidatus Omnitrophica bacterium]|nr:C4-type zinc ribbon domain-containing protein [Candidatus Omnitrophota bacterium]